MKTLSGSGGVNSNNTTVRSIQKATKEQYEAKKSSLTSDNEVQASGEKVYMWYENNTIYFYSEASTIYMPQNSGGMFRKFINLTDISGLAEFNTSYVTDMNRIMQDSYNLTSLSAISGWDVSSVSNFQFAFGAVSPASLPMKYNSLAPLANWNMSSVTTLDQAFKGSSYVESIAGLENWNLSSVTNMNQAFNYLGKNTTLANADEMIDWDLRRVSNFTSMLNNVRSGFVRPIFSQRPGSWSGGGTYRPSGSALPAVTPPTPSYPALNEEFICSGSDWVKSGNVWTCDITVPNDGANYFAWEDDIPDYTGECAGTSCTASDKAIVNDSFDIVNTNDLYKEIAVTKTWTGDDVYQAKRPAHITARVKKNGTDVKVSEDSKWVKNGDNWNYTFIVFDDTLTGYTITEDPVQYYEAQIAPISIDATTGYGSTSITNTLKKHTLTIAKKITGNLAEIGKTFNYKIDVFDWHNNKIAAFSSSGTWGHNSNFVITDIPEGFTYDVAESNFDDYKVSYNIIDSTSGAVITPVTQSADASGTLLNDQTVTFTNNKERPVETGVFRDNTPFALMMSIAIGIGTSFTFYYTRKFKPKGRDG